MFKAVCPYTSQAVVVGQARNFVHDADQRSTRTRSRAGPRAARWPARPTREIVAAPETEELVAGYIEELNGKLNRWETIKKFAILPRDLSIEHGEITPSMKIKRRSVETNFADQIEKMYAGTLAQI